MSEIKSQVKFIFNQYNGQLNCLFIPAGVEEESNYTGRAYVGNNDLYLVMTRHHLPGTAKDATLKVLRSYTHPGHLESSSYFQDGCRTVS